MLRPTTGSRRHWPPPSWRRRRGPAWSVPTTCCLRCTPCASSPKRLTRRERAQRANHQHAGVLQPAADEGGGWMKGKWAQGIVPRNFAWVIKDQLAVCERIGGYGTNHRKVRRQEEIIWVREQGFARIISLLLSPHNLHAYDELGVAWLHSPFGKHDDPVAALEPFWRDLRDQL